MHDDTLDQGLRAVSQAVQDALIGPLGLAPEVVPPEFAEARGHARGQDFVLHSQRYSGADVARLTTGLLSAVHGPAVGLVLAVLPRPGSARSILGVDLFAHGPRLGLVVADLSPTDPSWWAQHAAPVLDDLHGALEGALQRRVTPGFGHDIFSPRLVVGAAHAGREAEVLETVERFIRQAAAALAEPAPADHPDHALANLAWRRAMRANEKELAGFARLFGEPWARAYLDTHLFPDG